MSETVWQKDYWTRPGLKRWPSEDLVRFIARKFGEQVLMPEGLDVQKKSILELGCGNGGNTWFLAECAFTVQALDIWEGAAGAVKKAMWAHDVWNKNVSVNQCDLSKTPWSLGDASFDAVIDVHCMQHLKWSEHLPVYREIHRVLKPGGSFFSVHLAYETYDFNLANRCEGWTLENVPDGGIFPNCGTVCMPSPWAVEEVLNYAGFHTVQIEEMARTYGSRDRSAQWLIIEASKDPTHKETSCQK